MVRSPKFDAFDLIIKVLKEHEKSLNNLVERLGSIIENMQGLVEKLGEGEQGRVDEKLAKKVKELEMEIARYRAREINCIDALERLYPLEPLEEVIATN
ncbi:hypothetical protein KEJ21_04120 [Candidatus Bathyarchaeota archaeon]|nr:hypothetical protein [Candidatus Bathyarchaeota archaeon]MBS7630815.1 hypothetical protein [Candidatus Bathyarchaeota archaeon]